MAPRIAITYASNAPNGVLGVGWSLDGLSAIKPCPQTWATNGAAAAVKMDGTDQLCLDGEPLMDVSGNGTQFQTERDSFAKIKRLPASALNPAVAQADGIATPVFQVQTRDGETRLYKTYGPASRPATHWLLDRATDTDGNTVAYTYTDLHQEQIAGLTASVAVWEYHISTITYTGRVASNSVQTGERTLVFNYGGIPSRSDQSNTRPDPISMRFGTLQHSTCTAPQLPAGTTQCDPGYSSYGSCNGVSGTNIQACWITTNGNINTSCVAKYFKSATGGTYVCNGCNDPNCNATPQQGPLNEWYCYNATMNVPNTCTAAQATDVQTTVLLQSIDVWAPVPTVGTSTAPANVWSYEFNYSQSPSTHHTLLGSVNKVAPTGGGGRALHRIFTYDSATGVNSLTDVDLVGTSVPVPVPYYAQSGPPVLVGDINGNGTNSVLLDRGTHIDGWNVSHSLGGLEPATLTGAQLVDLNGDGLPEIVAPDRAADSNGNRWYRAYTYDMSIGAYKQVSAIAPYTATSSPTSALYFPNFDAQGSPIGVYGQLPSEGNTWAWQLIPMNGLTAGTPIPFFSCPSGQTSSITCDPSAKDQLGTGLAWAAGLLPATGASSVLNDGSGRATLYALTNPAQSWVGLGGGTDSVLWNLNGATLDLALGTGGASWTAGGRTMSLIGASNRQPGISVEQHPPYTVVVGNFDGRALQEIFAFDPSTLLNNVFSVDCQAGQCTGDNWSLRVMDVNQDGLDDVVAYHWFVNGQGFDSAYLLTWTNGVMNPPVNVEATLGLIPLMMGDFDGDGLQDWVGGPLNVLQQGQALLFKRKAAAHDVLQTVTDEGTAAVNSISYSQQWAGPLPALATTCTWPQHCINGGFRVVSSVDTYQGADVGFADTHYYTYLGPRIDLRGRGFLGFDTVIDWDPLRPEETITHYDNVTSPTNGAYIGALLPQSVTRTVPTTKMSRGVASVNVRQTSTVYSNQMSQTGSGSTFVTQVMGWTTTDTESTATIDQAHRTWPSHFQVTPSSPIRTRTTSLAYDQFNNLTSKTETTAGGVTSVMNMTPYPVDPNLWLLSRPQVVSTQVWTPSTQSAPTPRTVHYTYDPAHPALVQTKMEDVELGWSSGSAPTDPTAPLTTTYGRNSDGVITSTTLSGYDPVAGGATATSPCAWNSSFNCSDRTTSIVLDPDEGIFPRQVTNPAGHVTQTLIHPAFGVALAIIDPNNVLTQVVLDSLGRTRQVTTGPNPTVATDYARRTDAGGNIIGTNVTTSGVGVITSTTAFDMYGRAIGKQVADFAGDGSVDVTLTRYDTLGRVTFESAPYLVAANALVDAPAGGTTYSPIAGGTLYAQDPLDRLTYKRLPDGTSFSYTPSFFGTTTVDPNNHTSSVQWDADGRTTQSTQVLVSGTTTTNATVTYQYGAYNQVTQTTDAANNSIVTTYDARGRRVGVLDPDAGNTVDVYNGFGELVMESRRGVNCALAGGTNVCLTGLTASSTTAAPGANVTLTATASTNVGPTPDYITIADENGNVVANCGWGTSCVATVSSASPATHTYTAYLTAATGLAGGSRATVAGSVAVAWTSSTTVPSPAPLQATTYTRDFLGRVVAVNNGEDGGQAQYAWDRVGALGKLASSTSPDGTREDFGYDSFARPVSTRWTVSPWGPGSTAQTFTISMKYDSAGRPATTYYPSVPMAFSTPWTFSTQRQYSPTGYLSSITTTSGVVVNWATLYPTFWTVLSRAADGQLGTGQLGNGLVDTRGYDPNGRLLSIQDAPSGTTTTPVRSLSYTYDPDGNAKTRVDNVRSRSETFGYDSLHRLNGWVLASGVATNEIQYGYDGVLGNLTQVTDCANLSCVVTDTGTYPPSGDAQPHALTSSSASTYTYDDRGRQIAAASSRGIAYTSFDLPRTVTGGGTTTQFMYDAAHMRVSKYNVAAATNTVTLGGLYEQRTTPWGVTHVFYVPGSDGVMVQVTHSAGTNDSAIEYIHTDALGSSNVVTNYAGQGAYNLDYDPFGQRVNATGGHWVAPAQDDVTIGFTGAQQDDELGLVNMNGRIYDPVTRRFLSPDPHITNPLNSQNYNRYSYVTNNPLNLTDPTGFDWSSDSFGESGGVLGAGLGVVSGMIGAATHVSNFSLGFGGDPSGFAANYNMSAAGSDGMPDINGTQQAVGTGCSNGGYVVPGSILELVAADQSPGGGGNLVDGASGSTNLLRNGSVDGVPIDLEAPTSDLRLADNSVIQALKDGLKSLTDRVPDGKYINVGVTAGASLYAAGAVEYGIVISKSDGVQPYVSLSTGISIAAPGAGAAVTFGSGKLDGFSGESLSVAGGVGGAAVSASVDPTTLTNIGAAVTIGPLAPAGKLAGTAGVGVGTAYTVAGGNNDSSFSELARWVWSKF
jgi:RHS repeat-associated protein